MTYSDDSVWLNYVCGWMDGRMNEWTDGWMDRKWRDKWVDKRLAGNIDRWMNG